MDMDFPHPRRALSAGSQKPDYAALVAAATFRQATSQTVGTLRSSARLAHSEADILGSRIAYFSQRKGHRAVPARGAFWMHDFGCQYAGDQALLTNFCADVNLAGSTNGNSIQSYIIKPDFQVAERGTEL